MNLPSLRRYIPVLTLLIIALVLYTLPKFDTLFFAKARYEQCAHLAETDPPKALLLAREWNVSRFNSPIARHCEAIALFATRDYPHAAEAFLALGHETRATNISLSAQLLQQAAQAYETAGDFNAAAGAVSEAETLEPDNKEIKDLAADIAKKKADSPSPPAQPRPAP